MIFGGKEVRPITMAELDTDLKIDGIYPIIDADFILHRSTYSAEDGIHIVQILFKDGLPVKARSRRLDEDPSSGIIFDIIQRPTDE